jgi:ribonuclease J
MNHPHPGLPYPAKLEKKTLRLVALGGLGEIGRNMTVFEYEGKLLIVDCGVLFPGEDQPGIDLILPDFSYIKDRMEDIEAIFLTHGHEDHIGALPYLLRERSDIKVIGSQLTLAFVAPKLKERRITAPMIQVRAGQTEKVGPFTLEFITVNHSIPDSLAVAIKTPAGVILHTGDFKMDKLPLDGKVTDLDTFARLGREGVDLFLVDSTNADIPGLTVAEKDIYPALKNAIEKTPRRVVITSFASHVHRIQQVLNAAVESNRKVAYVGRSMVRNMKLAEDLGYLKVPPGLVFDYKDIDEFGDKIILICTGSQGEPLAALSRIANGDHEIRVGKGDTVVLASSLIPGNEKSVYRVINELTRFGAHVVHKGNAMVHVSGHASAGELLHCYEVVKPKNVLPVHGEWRHMRANADLAIQSGLSENNVVLAENGITIDVANGHADISGAIPCGYVYVDGQSVGEITENSLKDRKILGDEGFISVVVVIDSQSGEIVAGPDIHARGFTEDKSLFDDVKGDIEKALSRAVAGGFNGTHQLSQVVRKTIGSWVGEEHRRKPMIIPLVIEV